MGLINLENIVVKNKKEISSVRKQLIEILKLPAIKNIQGKTLIAECIDGRYKSRYIGRFLYLSKGGLIEENTDYDIIGELSYHNKKISPTSARTISRVIKEYSISLKDVKKLYSILKANNSGGM